MGTLNLCREMPDPMQKESAKSDHPAGRKRPIRAEILGYFAKSAKSDHIFDVFSGKGDRIDLISFAFFQASLDTSSEYPQHSISITLKFHFF